jgi:phosphoglycolate phosphatase
MKIQAKLGVFDHSGVLSDDRLPVYEANMVLLEEYGRPRMTFEEWLAASKASAGDLVLSCGVEAAKQDIDKRYEQVYNDLVNRKINPICPAVYPGTREALESLKQKDIRLAVVSSHPQKNLLRELDIYGIFSFFDVISGDPSPKTKRLCDICANLSVSPDSAFFVEDTVYGLRSGREAGVHCFGVTTGYHSRQRLEAEGIAVAVIDSLKELPKHIQ